MGEGHQLLLTVEVVARRSDVEPGLVGDRAQQGALQPLSDGDPEEGIDDGIAAGDGIHTFRHHTNTSRACGAFRRVLCRSSSILVG
ncbi:hypothetical protein [Streptomyces sp. NPDC046631]|uniref:hypothetical protein n=1 Tax=unclassified Streptomyces TaxID=2593676 RepID=UPI0033EA3216